ncbi:WXG100 family type VII secretion target [Paenibacillus sp.]|jgi:WXG100 family type VII secretion target|uniref:WXG100 family type VII secretion target n=1 Tax=Paenibacillus sp. TaxID=58172 RepID=UPI00281CA3AD|nr:WXG100 family type VII secretion target [Paenibacillus sp.]MDR0268490.1 WXG100 family type VII secretion target [Paenibacillus sp.]
MARILITPEEIDKVSSLFNQGSQQSRELASKLNSAIQSMQGQWDGMTQQRFFQRYETDKKNMETYITMLNEVSQELSKISERFRAADQQS